MATITLKRNGLERFQKLHPWVFKDNLRFSRSEVVGLYDLVDEEGKWLAKGLLNPRSKIAFRVLTRDLHMKSSDDQSVVDSLLRSAIEQRKTWLEQRYSCRLVHGESDQLSGLIVDAFFTSGNDSLLYLVVQSQSAGIDSVEAFVLQTLGEWAAQFVSAQTQISGFRILIKNDSSKRIREGLESLSSRVLGDLSSEDTGPIEIRVGSFNHPQLLVNMKTNLWSGQKTGFFLDQSFNIDVVYELALRMNKTELRVLDICSYVGQWSSKLSKGLAEKGISVSCVALDSSEAALKLTEENVKNNNGNVQVSRVDVFKAAWEVADESFDIVICDPPALIKDRKDMEVGKHGYTKINSLALRKVKRDGFLVACSCSGVLDREAFKKLLKKSSERTGRHILWVAEGRQSPDHPIRDWFPEGEYLKCFVGRVLN